MNIDQLNHFLSVADFRTFSHAGSETYSSASSLSKAVSSLEEELGEKLFMRSSNGLSLTEFGEYFYNDTVEAVRSFDNLKGLSKDYQSAVQECGSITVALAKFPGRASIINEEAFNGFKSLYPGIKFDLARSTNRSCLAMVEDRCADAALLIGTLKKPGIHYYKLSERHVCVVLSSTHPLSDRTSLSIAELSHYPIASAGDRGYGYRWICKLFKSIHEQPKLIHLPPEIDAFRGFLASGGIILSHQGAELEDYYPGASIIPVVNPNQMSVPIYIAWHSDNSNVVLPSFRIWVKGAISHT